MNKSTQHQAQQAPQVNSLEDYIGIGIIVRKKNVHSSSRDNTVDPSIQFIDIEKHRRFIKSVFSIVDRDEEEEAEAIEATT